MSEGSIRQKKDGYELRVRINGVSKSFYAKTKAEVKKRLRDYKTKLKEEENNKQYSDELLQTYIYTWLTTYKYGIIKDSSYDILERVFNNQIKNSLLGNTKLKDITIDMMQEYLNDMASKYSLSIVKKIVEILNPVFKMAVVNEKTKFNPLEFTKMPKKNIINEEYSNEDNIYNNEEIKKITDSCLSYYGTNTRNTRRYRYAPAYILLLNTGMRVGELAALTWEDIDFENKTIRINKTVTYIKNRDRYNSEAKKVNIITSTKTKKSNRFIPINEASDFVLQILKERQKDMGIISRYVISTLEGNFMQIRVLEQTFKRICEENCIKYKGLHTLRHTFASVLLRNKIDIKVVSEILGHSTVQFTYDRYIHIVNEMKAQALNIITISDIKYFDNVGKMWD